MITSRSLRGIMLVTLQQIALGAVVSLLLAGWLHIPDANAFEVAASIVLAVIIAIVAGAGESAIALVLAGGQASARRLLFGAGVVLAAFLFWYAISLGMNALSTKDALRAGYLNSRFPASLRNLFSYEHILLWLRWLWSGLLWIVASLLAAAAFACVTCEERVRGLVAILCSGRYWMSLLPLILMGAVVDGLLLAWTPGHGIRVEMLSIVLRMFTVVVLSAAAIALLLQAMASVAKRSQSIGTGEPAISQPRTVDTP